MIQKPNRLAFANYIGICGNPKSGKSLLQEFLQQNYDVTPIDDGVILREIAMVHFGAKRDDVYTQEGKAKPAYWPNGDAMIDVRDGSHMTWRQVLGRLGNQLEALFGEYVMPMTACARLDETKGPFSFGSVRKTQGQYFKDHDGVIVGLRNPDALPTGNDFDLFDESLVDIWIENDAMAQGMKPFDSRKDLEKKLDNAVDELRARRAA